MIRPTIKSEASNIVLMASSAGAKMTMALCTKKNNNVCSIVFARYLLLISAGVSVLNFWPITFLGSNRWKAIEVMPMRSGKVTNTITCIKNARRSGYVSQFSGVYCIVCLPIRNQIVQNTQVTAAMVRNLF